MVGLSSGKGALVVGFCIGSVGNRGTEVEGLVKSDSYFHDGGSFERMWDEVGIETGTRWVCETRMLRLEEVGWDSFDLEYMEDDARMLEFLVRRVG